MRITNKYIRNKHFRSKHWNRIKVRSHPYETTMPFNIDAAPFSYWIRKWTAEEQIKSHFEWIAEKARALENGHHYGMFHAPKDYRKSINKRRRANERFALSKINRGNYEVEIPTFKNDADWEYF